jgi:1-acyl-sn-glycerol-3-phosphate acyltransferase
MITMLPVALIFYIFKSFTSEKTSSYAIQRGFQIWMAFYMPMIGCPVTYVGRKNFKKGKNYIVTMNHNTLADVPVFTGYSGAKPHTGKGRNG